MLTVSGVEADEFLSVWQVLLPSIRRGLERGAGDTLTEKGLFSGVARGDVLLWLMRDDGDLVAAFFLQIDERDRGVALIVLNVVGVNGGGFSRRYVEEMLQRFREYGDMIGAYTIESYSRLGAARTLMRHGCKPKAMVMELRDGRTA